MMSTLFPATVTPPSTAVIGNYLARPITTADAIEDWLVIKTNAETIVRQREQLARDGWPFNCTLEDNYKDLAWLELCAHYGQLYCYVLRSRQDDRYTGAVYLYPIQLQLPDLADKFSFDVSFWITQSEEESGNYTSTYDGLMRWLVEVWQIDLDVVHVRNPRHLPNTPSSEVHSS